MSTRITSFRIVDGVEKETQAQGKNRACSIWGCLSYNIIVVM